MGSYSAGKKMLPFMKEGDYEAAIEVILSIIAAMDKEGNKYTGELTARFILTKEGPKLIELLLGLGDPGTMNILPLLKTDYGEICEAMIEGELENMDIKLEEKASVCKYLVSKKYPSKSSKGKIHFGSGNIYYNEVKMEKGETHMSGGRIAVVLGVGVSVPEAEKEAELTISAINGKIRYRKEIGTEEYLDNQITHMHKIRSERGK